MNTKFEMQDNQYEEPYHHFVGMDGNVYKTLSWGLSYFGYISRVMEHVHDRIGKGKKVADVGCGDGKLILGLSLLYPDTSFYGYDLSPRAIHFAEAYSYGIKNTFFNALDFSKSDIHDFDVITCIETMEHIPDEVIPGFVQTLRNNIAPSGRLIITVPSIVAKLHKKHYRHYDESILSKELKGMFEVERFEWVHNRRDSEIIRFFLINRFFILRFEPVRKILIQLYIRFFRLSNSKKGEHVLAICKPI